MRGLKFGNPTAEEPQNKVAPFAGAWIEIKGDIKWLCRCAVAPFAGAWIEILKFKDLSEEEKSHPSRVRGLKSRILVTPQKR